MKMMPMNAGMFASVALMFMSAASAVAQGACNLYQSGSTPPSGYAAAWDVFDSSRRMHVSADCATAGQSDSAGPKFDVTVGRDDSSQLVYSKLYSYKGNQWNERILAGISAGSGWLSGKGTASLYLNDAPNPFYFVGYVCNNRSGVWKCGCDSTACTVGKWQLQGYVGAGGGSTTGGTSTGGGGTTGGGGGGNDGPENPLPSPQRVLNASSCTELASRIGEASPGTHVVVEPGTYNCDLVVSGKNGTVGAPIVIRARTPLSATFTRGVRITGNYIGIHGFRFNGSIFRLDGDSLRISSNYLTGYTGCYRIIETDSSVSRLRLDHNEIASTNGCAGSGDGPNSYTFFLKTSGNGTYNYRIDRNYFHDNQSGNLVFVGTDNRSREYTTRHVIEYNLFERESDSAGESGSGTAIYTKSSGNIIRYNTLINSRRHHTNRLGRNNLWQNNWIENADGLLMLDCDNRVIGNKIINSPLFGISLGSGTIDCDDPFDAGNAVHRAAANTFVAGNEATALKIGQYVASERPIPVTNTRLESNTFGSRSINTSRSQGLTESGTTNVTVGTAVKLSPAQVGPNAPTAPRF